MPRPEEGLIHAWLDGQLPPDEAARIEQLAATDPEWQAAVAEARGLIAASSRILASLDHAPSGVIPEKKSVQPAWRVPQWAKVAAGIVLVAGGTVLVTQRANPPELSTTPVVKSTTGTADAPTTATPTVALISPRVASAKKKTAVVATPTAHQVSDAAAGGKEENAIEPARAVNAPVVEMRPKLEVADQAAPTAAGGVAAMRTVGTATLTARAAEPAASEAQAAPKMRRAAPPPAPASMKAVGSNCFRVREPRATADAGIIMRLAHADGDTLRLESEQGTSGLRAWIVWRDSLGYGAMTTTEGKGAVAIVATTTGCPAP